MRWNPAICHRKDGVGGSALGCPSRGSAAVPPGELGEGHQNPGACAARSPERGVWFQGDRCVPTCPRSVPGWPGVRPAPCRAGPGHGGPVEGSGGGLRLYARTLTYLGFGERFRTRESAFLSGVPECPALASFPELPWAGAELGPAGVSLPSPVLSPRSSTLCCPGWKPESSIPQSFLSLNPSTSVPQSFDQHLAPGLAPHTASCRHPPSRADWPGETAVSFT